MPGLLAALAVGIAGAVESGPSTSRVTSVQAEDLLTVSHDLKKKWAIEDYLCVTRNAKELACGIVVMTTETEATVRITERKEVLPKSPARKPIAKPQSLTPSAGDALVPREATRTEKKQAERLLSSLRAKEDPLSDQKKPKGEGAFSVPSWVTQGNPKGVEARLVQIEFPNRYTFLVAQEYERPSGEWLYARSARENAGAYFRIRRTDARGKISSVSPSNARQLASFEVGKVYEILTPPGSTDRLRVKAAAFEIAPALLLQQIGSTSLATGLAWVPSYSFSPSVELGLRLGILVFKRETGGLFAGIEYGAILSARLLRRIWIGAGPGAQTWPGFGGTSLTVTASASYRLRQPLLEGLELKELSLIHTSIFADNFTQVLRLGFVIAL